MDIIWYILSFLGGFAIATMIGSFLTVTGTLKIDTSNELTDVYRIEINNLDVIPKKKRIILKVDNSHK